jgi:hypothetical protein
MCAHVSWLIYAAQQSRHIQAADRFAVTVARGVTQCAAARAVTNITQDHALEVSRGPDTNATFVEIVPTVQNSRNDDRLGSNRVQVSESRADVVYQEAAHAIQMMEVPPGSPSPNVGQSLDCCAQPRGEDIQAFQ